MTNNKQQTAVLGHKTSLVAQTLDSKENKQQTAVEWFDSKIKQLEFWVETRQITWKEYHKEKDKLFEQAKTMHKKEIEDAELRGKEIIIIKHTEHGGGQQ
jgi:hypothetical protein